MFTSLPSGPTYVYPERKRKAMAQAQNFSIFQKCRKILPEYSAAAQYP
jgi:hypothetical protein